MKFDDRPAVVNFCRKFIRHCNKYRDPKRTCDMFMISRSTFYRYKKQIIKYLEDYRKKKELTKQKL